jgi:lipid-A-disaccharide synthase
MKYYLLAGETSGDQHAAGLIRAIRKLDPEASFRGMGGDACQKEGMEIFLHLREQNFMGFVEILRHLPKILGQIKAVCRDIQSFQPDVVVPVDYPGFNFRVMKWAAKQGFRVDYFIPPQVWAWHSTRANSLRKYCHQILVIFPFEVDFYKKFNVDVHYVGNPLLDRSELSQRPNKPLNDPIHLVMLPGSRAKEVEKVLPVMLQSLEQLSGIRADIAGMSHLADSLYQEHLNKHPELQVNLHKDQTTELLRQADIAWVTSGTATLETALMGVPQVVCYRGDALSIAIARRLIQVSWISLVNLLLQQTAIPELIQQELNPKRLSLETQRLMQPSGRNKQLEHYKNLRALLGGAGCSDKAARYIVEKA